MANENDNQQQNQQQNPPPNQQQNPPPNQQQQSHQEPYRYQPSQYHPNNQQNDVGQLVNTLSQSIQALPEATARAVSEAMSKFQPPPPQQQQQQKNDDGQQQQSSDNGGQQKQTANEPGSSGKKGNWLQRNWFD